MSMIGIDLFSGAGGLSLGAEMAGVKVKLAIDNDCKAVETYKSNFPNTMVLCHDIKQFDASKFNLKTRDLIIFGGPPCQGFSTSNQRTRNYLNKNNWLFLEFIHFVKIYRPKWFVFENVKGVVNTEKGYFLIQIKELFSKLGYKISIHLLNAAEFGVPQFRTRLFLIGSLKNKNFHIYKKKLKYVSVHEAINDLPELHNGALFEDLPYKSKHCSNYASKLRGHLTSTYNHYVSKNSDLVIERFKHVPQGGNWKNIPIRLMNNYKDIERCHTGIYHRLLSDEPSKVIGNYRKNMLIHPYENRGLSVREAARLQSFPDWFRFKGSIGYQQQQVGNAVPPLLSYAIFDSILKIEL